MVSTTRERFTAIMANNVYMKKEWYGSAAPSNIAIPLPTAAELVSHDRETNHHGYTLGAPYPPNSTQDPVFWIKYGNTVVWNELAGQKMAYDGLRSLGSQARPQQSTTGVRSPFHTKIIRILGQLFGHMWS